MFPTFHPLRVSIYVHVKVQSHTHVHIHTFLQNTLVCRIICNCEYIHFSPQENAD